MPQANPKKPEPDNSRNEYIPSFISKKPFYVADEGDDSTSTASDYLEHQRLQKSDLGSYDSKWYDRGKKLGPAATKFRKGACENCGAMTHKTRDCLSRPRKQGAKWTGRDIQADEVVQDVNLGWDAKRDRWNGYDPKEFDNTVEEYKALEDMKRKMQGEDQQNGQKLIKGEDGDQEADDNRDEGTRYEAETDMGRQQSTSTRTLRLREDTAKYLVNLDLDSAKYDPKTRSMVDSGATEDQAAALVAEEGFMKASGDATEFENAQRYAWETQERGDKNKIHLQANPTAGETVRRKERQESETKKDSQKKALLEKYGDQAQVNKRPQGAAAITESNQFVEYDERGLIKGAPKTKAKSQYSEDVMVNNHTSVWGSWWRDFQWGYACCHSTVKNSYCTGEEGKKALEETDRIQNLKEEAEQDSEEIPKQVAWKEEAEHEEHVPNGVDDEGKARQDVKARKRRLEEMRNGITEDEMEDYKRRRVAADDPMLQHLGKDELVH